MRILVFLLMVGSVLGGTPYGGGEDTSAAGVSNAIKASDDYAFGFGLRVAASNATDWEKNCADYVCDGTADDVEINAAIQRSTGGGTGINDRTGGVILLSSGRFVITSPIEIDRCIRMSGVTSDATELKLGDGANCNIVEYVAGYDSITRALNVIERIKFAGNSANNTSGWAIYHNNVANLAAIDTRTIDCWLDDMPDGCIYLTNYWNHQINECSFEHNNDGDSIAIFLDQSGGASPTTVHINNNFCTSTEQFVDCSVQSTIGVESGPVIIANNHIATKQTAITVGADNWIIADNTFGTSQLGADNTYSIIDIDPDLSITDVENILITGNTINTLGSTNNLKYFVSADGPFGTSIVNSSYKWTNSATDTDEYYLELAAGGDPGLTEPEDVQFDGVIGANGAMGALGFEDWAYGDNDSLGYNTIYVRLSGNADPDTKVDDYIGAIYYTNRIRFVTIADNIASGRGTTTTIDTYAINLTPLYQATSWNITGNTLDAVDDVINLDFINNVCIASNRISAGTGDNDIVADSDVLNMIVTGNVMDQGNISFPNGISTSYPPIIENNIGIGQQTLSADDTTPDVSVGSIFVTGVNTGATAITDLDNPRVGSTIKIIGAASGTASTIADSGNFNLSAAWTANPDDILILYIQADNDYIELGRVDN